MEAFSEAFSYMAYEGARIKGNVQIFFSSLVNDVAYIISADTSYSAEIRFLTLRISNLYA
jgi:hypothetical protein